MYNNQFAENLLGKVESDEKEMKYRTLYDSLDEGFCIIKVLFNKNDQPSGYRFLEVNPAFNELMDLDDPKGKRLEELSPALARDCLEFYIKAALDDKAVHLKEQLEISNRYYNVYAFAVGNSEEQKVAILFSDITRQKENEYSNALLGAIVNNSEDAIISKDIEGNIISWNKSAERLFGYTAEEAVGRNIRMIIPEDRLQEEDKILDRLRQGKRIERYETVRQHKNGSLLDISLAISPIRNSEGEVIGASKIARDIDEHKETEKKLKQIKQTLEERVDSRTAELQAYQQQLRSLASELNKAEEQERRRLAAELHNNLGQMLAVAKMKLKGLEISDLSDNKAEVITDLSEVIDEALTYTQDLMTELKPPPVLDKENVSKVIEWVVGEIEKYDLKVEIEDDDHPKPLTEEVRTAIYQCVRELLFNIVKYAEVDEARLIISRHQDKVRVVVEDEGKGFEMKEDQPIPTEEGGFGLFNVRERMEWIGGHFKIKSTPGEGTKAILHAPIKEIERTDFHLDIPEEKEELPPEDHEQQFELWEELDILIADDHQMVRNGFRKLIEKQYDLKVVGEASDGQETVKLARETKPDVILMDVNMPKMDGIEATKIISSEDPDVCIIGLSLHDRKEVVEDMLSAGACAYLSKDQAFETLCKTIRDEVKQKRVSD